MFVDGTDEVPERLQDKAWAIVSRMGQLTYIPDYMDFERLKHGVAAILIWMAVNDEINLSDYQQLDFFNSIQLRKSVRGIERKLISPVYQEVAYQELTARSILEERGTNAAAASLAARAGAKMKVM